ncbi:MAG: hypothetical protein J1E57_02085 [Prevotella sp.]|nr:hypothetical protein [Prevotella sp.]
MKKKFLSSLLFAALLGGVTSTFTACKDYDDDINNLQKQVDANSEAIRQIQALIQSGSVITSVTTTSEGVTVGLSNGNSFNIKNGKDGAAWTIGDDGYWYKDGVKTQWKAVGTDGSAGGSGAQGADGKYYVPNPETGCFDIYQNGQKVESTTISFLAPGTITATLDNENLTLYGVQGVDGAIVISLSGNLRSLVFIPHLYLDGIETIVYPYLSGDILDKKDAESFVYNSKRYTAYTITDEDKAHGITANHYEDYLYETNDNTHDASKNHTTTKKFVYGPVWPVDYHLNPSNANTEYADIVGFNVLEPDVIYMNTRAAADKLNVTSPEKDAAGETVFKNKDGILTVGLQIEHPELLNSTPTDLTVNEGDNTVALQAYTVTPDGEKAVVTSDYALLKDEKVYLAGLVWHKQPNYGRRKAATASNWGDENGKECHELIHIWDSPEEALKDEAALAMAYNDANGITISDYVSIHYMRENIKDRKFTLGEWKYGEEAKWGLRYEFNLVYYQVDTNETVDSKYAKWVDQSKGQVRAWNVDHAGNPQPEESASSVDRQPLVQVLVKTLDGDVVLDGYILIHITEQPVVKENKEITLYPAQNAEFDLCNDADVFETNWSQFNDYVLTQSLNNMEKERFDLLYEADLLTRGGGNLMRIFKTVTDATAENEVDDHLGTVIYNPNTTGLTNHTFRWILSAEELEELTHDSKTFPVQVVRYIRYKAKRLDAPYEYVYIKMTVNLTRANISKTKFGEKINEYWFGLDGNDNGWEAFVIDAHEPISGNDIKIISQSVRDGLVKNTESITGVHKYYFVPEAYEIIAQNGKKYTITSKSSDTDTNWDQLFCKYVTTPVANKHTYTRETLNEILNMCAIDYDKGAFRNKYLYAVYNNGTRNVYTRIAELNQTTGEITLIHVSHSVSHNSSEEVEDVLNAIGYEENHANINTELRSWLGVVSANKCDIAEQVEDGLFLVSWQRPINLETKAAEPVIDAKTEGNYIYMYDLLRLYDWRGPKVGYMWGDQQWFWAYYNVHAITIDVTPANMKTNMNQSSKDTWVKMSEISSAVRFYCYNAPSTFTQGSVTYPFNLSSYNRSDMNRALVSYMEANKELFGVLYYENNGANVTDFDVIIPITVEYEWGKFKTEVLVPVIRTEGN